MGRKVLVAFDLATFLDASQHHYEVHALLPDHAPEVFNRLLERSLRGDEELVVLARGGVDIVGVDVGIVHVCVSLQESDSRVLD